MKEVKDYLGQNFRCQITQYEGICIGVIYNFLGQVRLRLQAKCDKTFNIPELLDVNALFVEPISSHSKLKLPKQIDWKHQEFQFFEEVNDHYGTAGTVVAFMHDIDGEVIVFLQDSFSVDNFLEINQKLLKSCAVSKTAKDRMDKLRKAAFAEQKFLDGIEQI